MSDDSVQSLMLLVTFFLMVFFFVKLRSTALLERDLLKEKSALESDRSRLIHLKESFDSEMAVLRARLAELDVQLDALHVLTQESKKC